jgi:hypothetical protein
MKVQRLASERSVRPVTRDSQWSHSDIVADRASVRSRQRAYNDACFAAAAQKHDVPRTQIGKLLLQPVPQLESSREFVSHH